MSENKSTEERIKKAKKESYQAGIKKQYRDNKEKIENLKEEHFKKGAKEGYREGVFDTLRCLFTKDEEGMKKIRNVMNEKQTEFINNLVDLVDDIELHDSNPKH